MKDVSSIIMKIKISSKIIMKILISWIIRWASTHKKICLGEY